MKTLILGLGNPILSDDGVGLSVAKSLKGKWPGVDVATTAIVGLGVLDLITGYDKIFVIDACINKERTPGKMIKLTEDHGTLHLFSSHGLDFFQLLRLGKACGYQMPELGGIYGIEIGEEVPFGEEISPELKQRLAAITNEIVEDLSQTLKADQALAVRFGETPM